MVILCPVFRVALYDNQIDNYINHSKNNHNNKVDKDDEDNEGFYIEQVHHRGQGMDTYVLMEDNGI